MFWLWHSGPGWFNWKALALWIIQLSSIVQMNSVCVSKVLKQKRILLLNLEEAIKFIDTGINKTTTLGKHTLSICEEAFEGLPCSDLIVISCPLS